MKSQTQLKALETIKKVCQCCRYEQVAKHAQNVMRLIEGNQGQCEEVERERGEAQGRLQEACRNRDRARGEAARCQVAKDQMGKEAAERKEKEINKQIGNFKFCNCVVNDIKSVLVLWFNVDAAFPC